MERKTLKKLRVDLELTQDDLAKEIGISTIYVRKIEKGVANPGRNTMIKYEKFFNIDMRNLFPDLFFDINDTKLIKKKII